MKKNKIIMPMLYALALLLEALPYGAVCVFAGDEGRSRIRVMYSYFDLTPYGYANFGPLITAVLTSVLLLLAVIILLRKKGGGGLLGAVRFIGGIAMLTSVMPILYGIDFYSIVGAAITVLLAAAFAFTFVIEK